MTTPITTTTQLEALPAETLLRGGQPGYGPAYIVVWDAGDGRMLYSDCTERGYLEPAEVIQFHAPLTVVSPLPAPTVKPGREAAHTAGGRAYSEGGGVEDVVDAVLAILPGKTIAQVRAEALRDAADALAKRNFLLPRGHAPMPVLVDYLRVLADEEAGK